MQQATGDARGGIRQVILRAQQANLLNNTWPAFRGAPVDADLLLPVNDVRQENGLDDDTEWIPTAENKEATAVFMVQQSSAHATAIMSA